MTADDCMEATELHSTQEEADACLLLDAMHVAISGSKAVVVTAKDIDVFLLFTKLFHAHFIRSVVPKIVLNLLI